MFSNGDGGAEGAAFAGHLLVAFTRGTSLLIHLLEPVRLFPQQEPPTGVDGTIDYSV